MKVFAETKRLLLREIVAGDAPALFELDADPEVHRYLGNNPVTSIAQIDEVIRMIRKQYADSGIGRWAMIDKHTNAFVGWTGLKWVTEPINGQLHYYDLGYRLLRKYWGMGLATESAIASLNYGFNVLNAPAIFAIADIDNTSSNSVLLKVGLQQMEIFDHDGTPHHWYALDRQRWMSAETSTTKPDINL